MSFAAKNWLSRFALLAVVFLGPLLLEGTPDACSAVASRLAAVHASELHGHPFVTALAPILGGPMVAQKAAEADPYVPVVISCTFYYWVKLIHPN